MAKKWFFEPQSKVKVELEKQYDSTRFVDQTVTKDRVYEKFIGIKNKEATVLLYEYVKTTYGVGFIINRFHM